MINLHRIIEYYIQWQHFGNKKSVRQNKLCNRSKKAASLKRNQEVDTKLWERGCFLGTQAFGLGFLYF